MIGGRSGVAPKKTAAIGPALSPAAALT